MDIQDRIKKESIEMLEYFDGFCKKYNIEYSISFGTALGAVRHGGFIPWDDDVDVDMSYENIKKFKKCWKKYGNKQLYFFQSKKTDKYVPNMFPRLRKNGTTWIDPNCENIPLHWGLPIDIFPVYNLPKSKPLQKIQYKSYLYSDKFSRYHFLNPNSNIIKKRFYYNLTMIFHKTVCLLSNISHSSEYIFFPYGYPNARKGEKNIIFPTKPINFENLILSGPAQPDNYLTWQFGDYMTPPPEDQRGGHPIGIIDLDNDYSIYTGAKIE